MQGTGTFGDPYIITTAQELMNMCFSGSSGAHFALGADIDFNGCYGGDVPETIQTDCAELDGRGHKIRNIFISRPGQTVSLFTLLGDIRIHDISFENLRMSGTTVSLLGGDGVSAYVYRCTFCFSVTTGSSYTYNHSLVNFRSVTTGVELCSFVGRISQYRQLTWMIGGDIRGCQWDVDIIAANFGSVNLSSSEPVFDGTALTDCSFRGNLTMTGTSSNSNYLHMSKYSYFTNCIIMFCAITRINLNLQSYVLSRCIVNDEKKGNMSLGVNAMVSKLTDAQCRDAVYLRSIGFDCAEG